MRQLKSNVLSISAESIRLLVHQSEALAQESIDLAIEAGRRLAIAKTECAHGEWLPFLKRAELPERKAQRLMQIARSGLKSDTVSDLGGIKATLEFLSARKLPGDGEALSVTVHSLENNPLRSALAALVWPSGKHANHFFVAGFQHLDADRPVQTIFTKRSISGEDLMTEDGQFINPVWALVDRYLPIPPGNWHFHHMSLEVADLITAKFDVVDDYPHPQAA